MIKKERKKQPDGTTKTFIRVVEGYRPGPGLSPKQRPIRSFGYLEDHEDPVAFILVTGSFFLRYCAAKKDNDIIQSCSMKVVGSATQMRLIGISCLKKNIMAKTKMENLCLANEEFFCIGARLRQKKHVENEMKN